MQDKLNHRQSEYRAKVARLMSDKKQLGRELKDAATHGKNSLRIAKSKHSEQMTQLRLKVKSVKKLSKEAQHYLQAKPNFK